MIPGIVVDVGPEAVVVSSSTPLTVVSSAVSGGGLTAARAIINLHVSKDDRCDDPDGMLSRFASRGGIASPYVGLLTSAWTEHAAVAEAQAFGMRALAVITVGLGNLVAAGVDPVGVWAPSTINAVIVVDADPEPAALDQCRPDRHGGQGAGARAGGHPECAREPRERHVDGRGRRRGDRPRAERRASAGRPASSAGRWRTRGDARRIDGGHPRVARGGAMLGR